MADSRPWFKVDVGYFSNPKVAPLLDDHPRAIVFHLECIAYAKQHRTAGIVPMRVAMRIACAAQCDVDAAIDAGLVDRIDDAHVSAHDYEDHQGSADGALKRSEAAKAAATARWEKEKQAKKSDVSMRTACEPHSEPHADSNASGNADKTRQDKIDISGGATAPDRFEEFWAAYPKRAPHANPKKPARDKFLQVTKKTDPQTLIEAARAYAQLRNGEDPHFTAQAIKWLRDERWNDEAVAAPPKRTEYVEPPFVPFLKLHPRERQETT